MTIFSGLLKSGNDLPAPRTVPNGGLGGLVQLGSNEDRQDGNSRGKKNNEQFNDRKRPPPITLNLNSTTAPALTAPLVKTEDGFNRSLRAPRTAVPNLDATANVVNGGHGEIQDLSSRMFWQRSKRSPPNRKNSSTIATEDVIPRSQPIELPGSLLLPGQGYQPTSPPPLNSKGWNRAYPDQRKENHCSIPVSFVHPRLDTGEFKPLFSPPQNIRSLEPKHQFATYATATIPTLIASPSVRTLMTKDISTLSAQELLLILPKLKSKAVTTSWIPAMEKEFAKIKALIEILDLDDTQESRIIQIFSEDIRNLLKQSMKIAATYDEGFASAQAAIDINRQTDLEKLDEIKIQLDDAVNAYKEKVHENLASQQEYRRLRNSLNQVKRIFGGFIRNNLANTLHNTDEGVTQEIIKMITAFDRDGPEMGRQGLSRTIISQSQANFRRNSLETHHHHNNGEEFVREEQRPNLSESPQLEQLISHLEFCTEERSRADEEIASLKEQLEFERLQGDEYRERLLQVEEEKSINEFLGASRGPPQRVSTEVENDIQLMIRNHAQAVHSYEALIDHLKQQNDELARENAVLADVGQSLADSLSSSAPGDDEHARPNSKRKGPGSGKSRNALLPVTKDVDSRISPLNLDFYSATRSTGLSTQLSNRSARDSSLTIIDTREPVRSVDRDPAMSYHLTSPYSPSLQSIIPNQKSLSGVQTPRTVRRWPSISAGHNSDIDQNSVPYSHSSYGSSPPISPSLSDTVHIYNHASMPNMLYEKPPTQLRDDEYYLPRLIRKGTGVSELRSVTGSISGSEAWEYDWEGSTYHH